MNLDYLYQGAADDFVDELAAGTAVLAFRDQATIGRVAFREASGYRTMTSSIIFGALQGPNRDALLAKYVDFLLHGSGVEEPPLSRPPAEFRAARNPVRKGQTVSFQIPPIARGAIAVFDAAGREVLSAIAEPGTRRIEFRADLPAGAFVARLSGDASAVCSFSVVR